MNCGYPLRPICMASKTVDTSRELDPIQLSIEAKNDRKGFTIGILASTLIICLCSIILTSVYVSKEMHKNTIEIQELKSDIKRLLNINMTPKEDQIRNGNQVERILAQEVDMNTQSNLRNGNIGSSSLTSTLNLTSSDENLTQPNNIIDAEWESFYTWLFNLSVLDYYDEDAEVIFDSTQSSDIQSNALTTISQNDNPNFSVMDKIPLQLIESLYIQISENSEVYFPVQGAIREKNKTTLILSEGYVFVVDNTENTSELKDNKGEVIFSQSWDVNSQTGNIYNISEYVNERNTNPDEIHNALQTMLSSNSNQSQARRLAGYDDYYVNGVSNIYANQDIGNEHPHHRPPVPPNIIRGVDTTNQHLPYLMSQLTDTQCMYFPCMAMIGVAYPAVPYNRPVGMYSFQNGNQIASSYWATSPGFPRAPVAGGGGIPVI